MHNTRSLTWRLCLLLVAVAGTSAVWAQGGPDHPKISVDGASYTPSAILDRNMGTPADQTTAFPPHRIIGGIYYVGTTLDEVLMCTAV